MHDLNRRLQRISSEKSHDLTLFHVISNRYIICSLHMTRVTQFLSFTRMRRFALLGLSKINNRERGKIKNVKAPQWSEVCKKPVVI